MDTKEVIKYTSQQLNRLSGHVFDVLSITKPINADAAANLAKIVSKLSPIIGNLIEFNVVDFLNEDETYTQFGVWKRQDPDFPDAIFNGSVEPKPGFEIKAWFPLATEITARFKDSQNHFADDQTYVCLIAWLPEYIVFGKPEIIGVCTMSGKGVAKARDDHYHNPPDYLVLEPGDTRQRTRNLQQTNTNGYKWQEESAEKLVEARKTVASWVEDGKIYKPTADYQQLLRNDLLSYYSYRLDTNFAKMDRIKHTEIEQFKNHVFNMEKHGLKIKDWLTLFSRGSDEEIKKVLQEKLNIRDQDPDELVQ